MRKNRKIVYISKDVLDIPGKSPYHSHGTNEGYASSEPNGSHEINNDVNHNNSPFQNQMSSNVSQPSRTSQGKRKGNAHHQQEPNSNQLGSGSSSLPPSSQLLSQPERLSQGRGKGQKSKKFLNLEQCTLSLDLFEPSKRPFLKKGMTRKMTMRLTPQHIEKEKKRKQKHAEKRSRFENEKREGRAKRLFDYIDECTKQEKEERTSFLSELVALQKIKMDEKALELTKQRLDRIEAKKQEKKKVLAEKKKLISTIGKTPVKELDPKSLSTFYKNQQGEMTLQRQKFQQTRQQLNEKRKLLFQTFSAQKPSAEEGMQISHDRRPVVSTTNINIDQDENIIEKYLRPDSPVVVVEEKINQVSLDLHRERTLKEAKDNRKKMLENVVKHKQRTLILTSGQPNHFGIISSISEGFNFTLLHGRSEDDDHSKENPDEPTQYYPREPTEFIIQAKKNPTDDIFIKSLKKSDMAKRSEAFVEIVLEDSFPEEPLAEPEKKHITQFNKDQQRIIWSAEAQIQEKTRRIKFKTKKDILADADLDDSHPAKLIPDGNHDFTDNDEISDLVSISSHPISSNLDRLMSYSNNIQKRVSMEKQTQGRSRKGSAISINSTNDSFVEKEPLQLSKNFFQLQQLLHKQIEKEERIVPFSKTYNHLSIPKDQILPPLSEWLTQVKEKQPVKRSILPNWAPISLDAVAEFGKTKYTKKMFSSVPEEVVNLAEQTSRPIYHGRKLETFSLDSSGTHDYEYQSSKQLGCQQRSQMPIFGSKMRFWPTTLKIEKDEQETINDLQQKLNPEV